VHPVDAIYPLQTDYASHLPVTSQRDHVVAMGKMRNCGMMKVKCRIKNAEWRWLVEATNQCDHWLSAD